MSCGLILEYVSVSILGTDLQFFTFTFTTFNYYLKKTPPQYGHTEGVVFFNMNFRVRFRVRLECV